MQFKNVSVAVVSLFMAASILSRTSGCLSACSCSTSYGNLLKVQWVEELRRISH